ncbi:MAG: sugar phosphate isomerase/epimerase [Planctomycetota bacterium]|nr:sugar phosphate isomerase/epimerase [Planctomycetota bacterium]
MFTLAFSTNAFKKHSLEEAVRSIAAAGYPAVEIMADTPHAYPAKFTPQDRLHLKNLLASLNLAVSNINAFTLFAAGDTYHPTFFEPDPAKRELRILHSLLAIQLAADLGSKTLSLQPGGPLIGTNLSRHQAAQLFAQGLNRLLPTAHHHNITLAIEPEPGLFIESAAEYLEFKSQYFPNDPAIAMNCDLGHLFCVGEDPAAILRAMPREIAHIHLEDIAPTCIHQHLPPGQGAIDFPAIFSALADIHYTGYVTVELYPYESTAATIAQSAYTHLQQLLSTINY